MKKKWLGITLALLVVVVAAVATVITLGDTKADAADMPLSISVAKTEFIYGEPITATVSGLTEEMRARDLEFRLEKRVMLDTETVANRVGSYQYFDIGLNARDEDAVLIEEADKSETMSWSFANGKRAHPEKEANGLADIPVGTYTLWVIDFTETSTGNYFEVANRITVTIVEADFRISTEKTTFGYGDPIVVNYYDLTKSTCGDNSYHAFELRLENRRLADDVTAAERPGYFDWVNIASARVDAETGYAPINGSVTFQNGNTAVNGTTLDIPPGEYTLWVIDFTPDTDVIVSNLIHIKIEIKIEVKQTEFYYGDPIKVNYTGLKTDTSLPTDGLYHDGTNYHDLELRIEKGRIPDNPTYADRLTYSYFQYFDIGKNSLQLVDGVAPVSSSVTFLNGTQLHPDYPENGNADIIPGEYSIWIIDFTTGTPVGNVIHITVLPRTPKLTMAKDTFFYGEDITFSYENLCNYEIYGTFFELDLFPVGKKPGEIGNTAGHTVYTSDKSINIKENGYVHSGTLTFPEDDNNRNYGSNFPLAVGDYYICFRRDNTIIGEVATFSVVAPTIEPTKTTYKVGEPISVNYSGLYFNVRESMDLRLYPLDPVIGTTESLAWSYLINVNSDYNSETDPWYNEYTYARAQSGTITWPADDDRTSGGEAYKLYQAYPAGDYLLMMVDGAGKQIGDAVEISIESPFDSVAPLLTDSVTLFYDLDLGSVFDSGSSKPVLTFTMEGESPATVEGVKGQNGLWRFAFTNIVPQDIGKNISASLSYADNIRTNALGTYDAYSVKQYCTNMLNNEAYQNDTALRTLLINLLNYGAEAQTYFDGLTDGLVNEGYENDVKVYDMSAADAVSTLLSGNKDTEYYWNTATLSLMDYVQVRFKFTAPKDKISGLTVDINGTEFTSEDFVESGDYYFVYSDGISANAFDEPITAKFYVDGNPVGQTVSYSVSTYVKWMSNRTSAAKALVQAMYNYGMAASEYTPS